MKLLLPFLLFVMMASSCGKIEDPQFRRVEGFGLKNIGFQEATVRFQTTYYNPNNFGVTVKEAAFDIYLDTSFIGKFYQPNEVVVAKKAEFSIPLEGKISLQKAARMNFSKWVGKEVLVKATGTARIGKGGVYITKDINYSGRQVINADLIKNPAGAGSR